MEALLRQSADALVYGKSSTLRVAHHCERRGSKERGSEVPATMVRRLGDSAEQVRSTVSNILISVSFVPCQSFDRRTI